jgi:putative endonuclease
MDKYHYVYVLCSEKDGEFYVGYTKNLWRRLDEHNSGQVRSTKKQSPMKLIYWEGCTSQRDAKRREKYLKTAWGKRYIKARLKDYLLGFTP